MDINKTITSILAEAGWTKTMLAKELGVSTQALSRFLLNKKHKGLGVRLIPYLTGEQTLPKIDRKKRRKVDGGK